MSEVADPSRSVEAELAAWKSRHADGFDPVRFRFMEALVRRSASLTGAARTLVDTRIAKAFAEYQSAFDSARSVALRRVDQAELRFPAAATALRQRFNACDFRGVEQLAARLERSARRQSLSTLLTRFARNGRARAADVGELTLDEMLRRQELSALQATPAAGASLVLDGEQADELRAMRQFRDAWAKRVIEKAVVQAVEDAPENAGPLNSHRLVIGAITRMRDISPDYLNRFVAYVDTLLWLEQATKQFPVAELKTADMRPSGKTVGKAAGRKKSR